ncbi:hypothetical protein GCM10023190_16690 [Enteractinococcus fodinae]|uniref:Alternate signal-mediated exported protein n=1 Tax=Enteractinococcus fodinae TaxID=684663 RepID=A0ABU2AWX7_9MICC|nr:alternate-type signal peptide domain-containing protein [Enteractinococcus fodinae]MDR7345860.1 alternate signal-mediated exported protein [Enteractinococcus fodinae]
MKNTTKGFLAGAAGLGLVLGGSTFALWTDTAGLGSDTTLTAGNLAVGVVSSEWRDISYDRSFDRGHRINNIEKFRIIPGDKIQAKYGVSVGLEGDNMVAKLRLKDKDGNTVDGALAPGLKVTYKLERASGGFWPFSEDAVEGDGDGVEVNMISKEADLYARDNNIRLPFIHMVVDRDVDNKADFNVTVTVEFTGDDLDYRKAKATLADAQLELEQVREDVFGYR